MLTYLPQTLTHQRWVVGMTRERVKFVWIGCKLKKINGMSIINSYGNRYNVDMYKNTKVVHLSFTASISVPLRSIPFHPLKRPSNFIRHFYTRLSLAIQLTHQLPPWTHALSSFPPSIYAALLLNLTPLKPGIRSSLVHLNSLTSTIHPPSWPSLTGSCLGPKQTINNTA